MKKVSELALSLGFRDEAPESLKEAYVRHLIRDARGGGSHRDFSRTRKAPRNVPQKSMRDRRVREPADARQLSFDFMKEAPVPKKKIS